MGASAGARPLTAANDDAEGFGIQFTGKSAGHARLTKGDSFRASTATCMFSTAPTQTTARSSGCSEYMSLAQKRHHLFIHPPSPMDDTPSSTSSSMTLQDHHQDSSASMASARPGAGSRSSSAATRAEAIVEATSDRRVPYDITELAEKPSSPTRESSASATPVSSDTTMFPTTEDGLVADEKEKAKKRQGRAGARRRSSHHDKVDSDAAEAEARRNHENEKVRDASGFSKLERRLTDAERAAAPMTDLRKVVTLRGELIYVGWDGPDDPANPRNWTHTRKWTLSIIGFLFCS